MGTTPIAWNIPKTDATTLNVNLRGNGPSAGSEIVGSLSMMGMSVFGSLLSNAMNSPRPSETSQQSKQNALANALLTTSGSSMAAQLQTTALINARQELSQLASLAKGDGDKKVTDLDAAIKEKNNGIDPEYTKALSDKDEASQTLSNLEAQFNIDKGTIKQVQTTANIQVSDIVADGITIKGTKSGDYVSSFNTKNNNNTFTQKVAPAPLEKADSKDNNKLQNYKTQLQNFQKYQSFLALEPKCQENDRLLKQKEDGETQIKEFKKTYGDNLDGKGGSYNKEKGTAEGKLTVAQGIIDKKESSTFNNSTGTNSENLKAKQKLEEEKAKYQASSGEYTKVTTDKDGKTSTSLDTQKLKVRIDKLNKYIAQTQQVITELNALSGLNSQIEQNTTLSKSNDKADGNWFSRNINIFNKNRSTQKAIHKAGKTTDSTLESLQLQAQSLAQKIMVAQGEKEAILGT